MVKNGFEHGCDTNCDTCATVELGFQVCRSDRLVSKNNLSYVPEPSNHFDSCCSVNRVHREMRQLNNKKTPFPRTLINNAFPVPVNCACGLNFLQSELRSKSPVHYGARSQN